ncbi:hypothetical protein V492_07287 [Pseudogymnoascus sp. VKM F-4246]|nr:hypothetical protein V492_07287 [Pseudogymnoascus sp. VKM F-4246]
MRVTRSLNRGFIGRSIDELQRYSRLALKGEAIRLPTAPYVLKTFDNPEEITTCKVISDADMGGFTKANLDWNPPDASSSSKPANNPQGYARFHGSISIDLPANKPQIQRTGYAAWRTRDRPSTIFGKSLWDIDPYTYLAMRIKSDGRKYFVNLQTESIVPSDIHQHRVYARKPGEWETILIKWNDFVRTNHGTVMEPQTELMRQKVRTIGIGLIDRVPGKFDISIESIWATNNTTVDGSIEGGGLEEGQLKSKHGANIRWNGSKPFIGVLCLIELYTDSAVPISSTVPILSFIVSNLLPPSLPKACAHFSGNETLEDRADFIISIEDFERLLSAYPSASGLPGRKLWDAFLMKLWDINSLHALHDFFERRSHLLAKTREDTQMDTDMGIPPPSQTMILLSRASPLGAFVRRAQLEFTRLKFQDTLNLWTSFIAYRQATLSTWKRRNASVGAWSFDVVLEEADKEWDQNMLQTLVSVAYPNVFAHHGRADGLVSTNDVEKLLEFQIEQMQKLGNRVPETLQQQFEEILRGDVMVPSLSHYVKFLDAWRAGDYPTSFDNLHRFFDYTMQNRDRLFYQYALLNLAVLQADFGCYQEAAAAMQETVSTARENKDMGCLNFSLSWLYHFGKAHPTVIDPADKTNMLGIEREGLTFLRVKAKESGMWSLWSSSLLSEAKMGLSAGESVSGAFENILRSSQLTISKNMMSNVGVQMLLQSSLWSRLGITYLAWSYCESFLHSYCGIAPFDDILKVSCRSAYLLGQNGQFAEARAKLEQLDPNSLRSLKASQYWLIFRGILQLRQALRGGDLNSAHQLLLQLLQCRGGDPDVSFELNILHIELMVQRGDYDNALCRVEEISSSFKHEGEDIFFRLKLLNMKALLFNKCDRPQKGFSVAVRAAAIAWRAHLLPPLWEAMGIIASVLTSLYEFAAASRILATIIPRALECEDAALSAGLWGFQVDAYMGQAGQATFQSLEQKDMLTLALQGVGRCFGEWSKLGDKRRMSECTTKKGLILIALREVEAVADAKEMYNDLMAALITR